MYFAAFNEGFTVAEVPFAVSAFAAAAKCLFTCHSNQKQIKFSLCGRYTICHTIYSKRLSYLPQVGGTEKYELKGQCVF